MRPLYRNIEKGRQYIMKRVYIIAGVIFILVFMVWELGRICYNVDLDSLLKKTENSLLDTSQEKNHILIIRL